MSFNFQDDETYPVEASESGKNAFHINGCAIIGQSQPYAACLHRINHYNIGDLEAVNVPECIRAIGGPACRAWGMRNEELTKGKATYYVNRDKLNAYLGIIATDRPAGHQITHQTHKRTKPTPTHEQVSQTPAEGSQGSYASVINAAMSELSTPAPVVKTEPIKPKPSILPGESPLNYARRVRELEQAQA